MSVSVLGAYALLTVMLCFVPGPAVLLVVSTSLRRGWRDGLAAACAINAGNATYFVLSGAGIVALLLASYQLFTFVKYAGAAYLAYLGLRALFARSGPSIGASAELDTNDRGGVVAERRSTLWQSFSTGYVTQISNPKAIVFFVAIVPQFVDPRGSVPFQLGALMLATVAIEISVLSLYTFGANRLRQTRVADRAALWIERAGGAVLLWIAVKIAREPLARAL